MLLSKAMPMIADDILWGPKDIQEVIGRDLLQRLCWQRWDPLIDLHLGERG
jgi:hypothetical protein